MSNGQVGQLPPTLPGLPDFTTFADSVFLAVQRLGLNNNNIPIPDVAGVLYSWWPAMLPQLPTPTSLPNDLPQNTIGSLIPSAMVWLSKSGIPGAQAYQIPWASIPWQSWPWNIPAKPSYTPLANVYAFLQSIAGPATGILSGQGAMPSSQMPRFEQLSTWSSGKLADVPWQNIAWDDPNMVAILRNPQIAQCLSNPANATNMQKMMGCQACYAALPANVRNEGIKKALCGQILDVCDCAQVAAAAAGTIAAGGGGTPFPFPGGGGTPFPFPGGGGTPSPTTPPEESDNTVWWIVGGAGALAVLYLMFKK